MQMVCLFVFSGKMTSSIKEAHMVSQKCLIGWVSSIGCCLVRSHCSDPGSDKCEEKLGLVHFQQSFDYVTKR